MELQQEQTVPIIKPEILPELAPLPFLSPGGGIDSKALDRAKALWPDFSYSAAKIEVEPHSLVGIAFRESKIQSILGDGGRGHGIMQLDTRTFRGLFLPNMPAWLWKEAPVNILIGAYTWQEKFDYLATQTDLTGPPLFWFATAAYNCGQGTMERVWEAHKEELAGLTIWDLAFWEICDSHTFSNDYARTVFRHYCWLQQVMGPGEAAQ